LFCKAMNIHTKDPILVVNKSLCGIPQLRLPGLPDVFLDTKT